MLSRILAGILAAAAAIVCIRLGFWQLDRHEQRAAQNAVIEQRLSAPPLALDASLDLNWDSHEFRRARVEGVFDYSREVIEQGRVVNGVPAVYIVTPLVTQNGRILLVE
ncbi:MAG: SURF1 family protein, partial [Gemmatimonadetes bacterium]|nr:SURF1 family protein [Gemmatimonadota bacterium]